MNNRSAIEAAIERILYPIARLLIDCGVTESHFARIARRVFVKVAAQKLQEEANQQAERARAQLRESMAAAGESEEEIVYATQRVLVPQVTNTRIQMLTGVPRKQLPAILAESVDDQSDDEWYRHRCAKVLSDWWRSVDYTNDRGRPLSLWENDEEAEHNDEEISFESLVKLGGTDLSYHALLEELISTDAVERLKNGRLRVKAKRYERLGVSANALAQRADRLFSLGETINAKLRHEDPAVDEGSAYSVDISEKQAKYTLRRLREMTEAFLTSVETTLKSNEAGPGEKRVKFRIGAGAYTYRGDKMAESAHFASSVDQNKKASNE